MSRHSRPSGTALRIAVTLAGVAVTGWAIADTAGIVQLNKSELPSRLILAAAPGPGDVPSRLPPPPRPDRPDAKGAGAMPGAAPGPVPGADAADARPPQPAGPPPLPGPAKLAELLATAETFIGVRADQIDTWRTFTDAALALVPEPPAGGPPTGASEPFSRPSEMANRIVSEGKKAEQLLAAIQQLKAKLTPAQLQRVAQFEAMMTPPPPPPGLKREPGLPPRGLGAPPLPGAPPIPN